MREVHGETLTQIITGRREGVITDERRYGRRRLLTALSQACLTVDFAHLYARQQGEIDYDALLPRLPVMLHAHFSGIEYTAKGEKKHIRMQPNYFRPLLAALKRHGKEATVICESPAPFEDAVMMKNMAIQFSKNGNDGG